MAYSGCASNFFFVLRWWYDEICEHLVNSWMAKVTDSRMEEMDEIVVLLPILAVAHS